MANDPKRIVSNEIRKAVLADYKKGKRVLDIEEEHGISRATLYWILDQAGVMPDRAKRGERYRGTTEDVAVLYQLIETQAKAIERLELAKAMAAQDLQDAFKEGVFTKKQVDWLEGRVWYLQAIALLEGVQNDDTSSAAYQHDQVRKLTVHVQRTIELMRDAIGTDPGSKRREQLCDQVEDLLEELNESTLD